MDWPLDTTDASSIRSEERLKEHERFQQLLGEPDRTFEFLDTQYGVFRVDGGVFIIPKREDGFHHMERIEYTEEAVRAISEALECPPRKESDAGG